MTAADDRADQIRARLAAVTPGVRWVFRQSLDRLPELTVLDVPLPSKDDADLMVHAPADLAFLLAERDELLRRVEQAEEQAEARGIEAAMARDAVDMANIEVEQAERAGAVKALRSEASRAAKAGNVWAAEWNDDAADNYENGTQE